MNLLHFLKGVRRNRRILVIGASSPTDIVASYAWEDSKKLNITDYDVVILNLTTLRKDAKNRVCWYDLPPLEGFIRLLFNEQSEIILVGNPHFEVRDNYTDILSTRGSCRFAEWWLPVFPDYELKSGETIQDVKREFAFYFKNVKRWSFHLNMKSTNADALNMINVGPSFRNTKGGSLGAEQYGDIINTKLSIIEGFITPLARTRLLDPIGFKLRFTGKRRTPGEYYKKGKFIPAAQSCEVICLPEPTEVDSATAIHLILKERYNIALKHISPVMSTKTFQEAPMKKGSDSIKVPDTAVQERYYDLAISFAGEDRAIAQTVADKLIEKGAKVFYDKYEQADLWGKDLYSHLNDVYGKRARYCLILISQHYARKQWTNHERKAAQSKAFSDHEDYILPLKLDKTEIPGLLPTVGYIDLENSSLDEVIKLLLQKLEI